MLADLLEKDYIETKLILDAQIFARHATDRAAVFLHRLREYHDCPNTPFPTDALGHRIALARVGVSGRIGDTDRNP